MQRFASTLLLVAAAAAASACTEQQHPVPSAPDYHVVTSATSECDPIHTQQLANSYFTQPRQQAVRDLLTSLFAQTAFSSGAKSFGFDVLANIDTVVSAGTAGDPTVGSDLVNHLILCMYNRQTEAASYPETFPEDFTVALTATLHGQFHVKPSSAADALPVLSRDTTVPFSGIGVESGNDWPTTLSGNTPARVLIYGRPGSTSTSYIWNTLPHNVAFSPQAIVGVCNTSGTALISDDGALIPYADAYFMLPGCSDVALRAGAASLFAQRLIRLGASVLGPSPLWALTLSPGGTGGRLSGVGSEFAWTDVSQVQLAFGVQPTSTSKGTTITPPVTVVATAFTSDGTKPAPDVTITVTAVNNNGATVTLGGTLQQVTDGSGIATFDDLSLNKSGGYRLFVTGSITGRSILVSPATSDKFNIAPR